MAYTSSLLNDSRVLLSTFTGTYPETSVSLRTRLIDSLKNSFAREFWGEYLYIKSRTSFSGIEVSGLNSINGSISKVTKQRTKGWKQVLHESPTATWEVEDFLSMRGLLEPHL